MSAISAALRQRDDVAAEGDLAVDPLPSETLALEPAGEPIVLPDGRSARVTNHCTGTDASAHRSANHPPDVASVA